MKIGFLGNTNNYPFLLAYELKDKCEILFFVDADKNDFLNRPEYYYGNLISYPYPTNFIENNKLGNIFYRHFPVFFASKTIKQLNQCDAIIVNGIGHTYLPFLRKKIIKINVFSGADLDISGNWKIKKIIIKNTRNYFLKVFNFLALKYSQCLFNRSVFISDLVSYFPEGLYPEADEILATCKKNKSYNRFAHMHLSVKGIDFIPPRENSAIKIVNASRFVWKRPFSSNITEVDNKGNDILIRGIAMFLKRNNYPLDIHFIEKGIDVDATKSYLEELGISKYVTWHKNMSHSAFLKLLASSDIITDNMTRHVIGGGAFGMAMGRPLIGNAIPDIMDKITGTESEMCHSENEEDVYNWLNKLVLDKVFREEKGKASRDYILKYHNLANEAAYFFDFIKSKIQN